MNTATQTEPHALTEAQLKTVNGAMTREQRLEWHRMRQEAARNGEDWRIPRPGSAGWTIRPHPAFGG